MVANQTDPCAELHCVHGDCEKTNLAGGAVSVHCLCSFGFFGDDCSVTPADSYPTEWNVVNWILVSVFALIAILSLFQLAQLICQDKRSRSYRKIMMASVMLAALLRCVWLVIDPFAFRGIFPDMVESFFYQLVPGLICTAFSFVLAFWIKLVRVLVPYTMLFCKIRIEVILILLNLTIWVLLIPEAILLNMLPRTEAPLVLTVYVLYLGAYLLLLAVGFLTIGLTLYFYYVHPIGMAKINNQMITKMTLLAVLSSLILMVTILVLLLGAPFAIAFTASPLKFFVFQTIYRVVECAFCAVVLALAGDWDTKAWHWAYFTRRDSHVYGALSLEYDHHNPDSEGEWEE